MTSNTNTNIDLLNTLCLNLMGCIADFLPLPDLFRLKKVNKRLNKVVTEKSKMFIKFVKVKNDCKIEDFRDLYDLINNNSAFLIKVEDEMLEKEFTSSEISHLMYHVLLTYSIRVNKNKLVISNTYTDKTLEYIKLITDSSKCPFLILSASAIKRKGIMKFIVSIIKANSSFYSILLRGCVMEDEVFKSIAETLKYDTNLREVDLRNSKIGRNGAVSLAEALKVNKTIREIELDNNIIGAEGCKALAKALEINSTLIKIDLNFNNIGDEGAWCLDEALMNNSTLQEINLWGNNIGDEAAKSIFKSLLINHSLIRINLNDIQVALSLHITITEVIEPNLSLQMIFLKTNNNIKDEGAKLIDEELKFNNDLLLINLEKSNIAYVGVVSLDQALVINSTLEDICLSSSNNNIGGKEAQLVAEAFKFNKTCKKNNLELNDIVNINKCLDEPVKVNKTIKSICLNERKNSRRCINLFRRFKEDS